MANCLIDNFEKNVFNDEVMKERLSSEVYTKLKMAIDNREKLDISIADEVASAMKGWAIEKGATHFTHWFQPMTGLTAEKHDSFVSFDKNKKMILEFSGKELIQGESDASSFPSGGLRQTFEARGYTTWDCTSPVFLKETKAGVTLCIPTIFCSYTGEALDKKTPLLRSIRAINQETIRALKEIFNVECNKIDVSVGPEQEYFLVDRDKYLKREDLIFTGRTLFGAQAPKSQAVEAHYYGTIKENVLEFMKEVNIELWKLGVYAKTQHNEAAPAQYEIAPIYNTVNIATDHNQLTMEALKRVARHHNLEVLLHEKPFKGVNGSGKHNNWSLITDSGKNLFSPGKMPHENNIFLFFLTAVIKAVDENALLLRMASSGPGNDFRLGGHEAPPAIISIYLGDQIGDIVNQIINTGDAKTSKKGDVLNTGVDSVIAFRKDATDRNRTSPFAFTGNKFEFRMVGSSESIACTNIMLNGIVADSIREMTDEVVINKKNVREVIKETLTKHQRIIFNGNNYTEEWKKEAKKRGLPNAVSFVDSIKALIDPHTIEVMDRNKIYTKTELESRAEIYYGVYAKTINIEAMTMIEMASKQYIPAVIKYMDKLSETIVNVKQASNSADTTVIEKLLNDTSILLLEAKEALENLKEKVAIAETKPEGVKRALFYRKEVFTIMGALRYPIDKLELLVDADLWPVPSYGDLMFN
ncbi:MAG: glutamine synthetase III [Acholeplasmatales bacterium]|nr:glutamine synthetase III [Acholeplasmatales bacterium]